MTSPSSLFLQALQCRNTSSRPPVWLMRQAGRHMSAYRALRQKHSFLDMCHQPDLIAEATLLPIRAYGMDAAILFSDILVIPEALGLGLRFEDSIGPIIERPIVYQEDIDRLAPPDDISALRFVYEGIKQTKPQLNVPLIGFCGAPFTVASYMIEGKTSRHFKKTKQLMLANPEGFHRLLKKIADWSIAYLNLQIDAGVDAIQIFDSWANSLAHRQFREFSLSYLSYIMKRIKGSFRAGHSFFVADHPFSLLNWLKFQPSAIGLDWNCDLTAMRAKIPYPIALQGNLDPDILYAPTSVLEKEVNLMLDGMEGDPGFIFNLGHGVFPDVSEATVRALVDCVKKRASCPAAL